MAMNSRRPGALDEGFLENVPNVFPAGQSPWLENNPQLTLPEAGEVRPEWNSVWIRPGMLLEPGTGFGSEGRSSALQALDFPMFPFIFPPLFGGGGGQVPPPPSQQNPAGESDYLADAIAAGGKFVQELGKAITPKTSTFLGPEALNNMTDTMFGPEPQFDLSGNVTAGGKPSIEGTPFFEGQHTLFPETGGLSVTGLSPATIASLQDLDSLSSATPLLSGSRAFFDPETVNQVLGLGTEPALSLTGPATTGLDLSGMGLGVGNVSSTSSSAPSAAGATSSLAGPLAAAGAAIPIAAKALGANEDIQQGSQLAGTGLGLASAGLTAATATGLGALAPALAMVSWPLVVGPILNDQLRKHGIWGHDPTPPPGFIPIPWDESKGRNPGLYVNPNTGVIIQRKGNRARGFELSAQSREGRPVSVEQARSWGIPIPGLQLTPEEIQRTNPQLYQDLVAMSTGSPISPYELEQMGAGNNNFGLSPDEYKNFVAQVTALNNTMNRVPRNSNINVFGGGFNYKPSPLQGPINPYVSPTQLNTFLDPRLLDARNAAIRELERIRTGWGPESVGEGRGEGGGGGPGGF